MTHLDEGAIVTLRDGALVAGEAREHLTGCSVCRTAVAEAERRSQDATDTAQKNQLMINKQGN